MGMAPLAYNKNNFINDKNNMISNNQFILNFIDYKSKIFGKNSKISKNINIKESIIWNSEFIDKRYTHNKDLSKYVLIDQDITSYNNENQICKSLNKNLLRLNFFYKQQILYIVSTGETYTSGRVCNSGFYGKNLLQCNIINNESVKNHRNFLKRYKIIINNIKNPLINLTPIAMNLKINYVYKNLNLNSANLLLSFISKDTDRALFMFYGRKYDIANFWVNIEISNAVECLTEFFKDQ